MAKKYLALQAWNLYLSGPKMWTVDIALRDDAPEDALYSSGNGKWGTVRDLAEDHPFNKYFADCRLKGYVS